MTTLSKPRTSQWPARLPSEDCKPDGLWQVEKVAAPRRSDPAVPELAPIVYRALFGERLERRGTKVLSVKKVAR